MPSGSLSLHPYPYLVNDGFFPAAFVSDMRRNWPGEGNFRAEIPGNYVCDVTPFTADGFWREFTTNVTPYICAMVLAQFAEYLEARYPGERHYFVRLNSLMQAEGNYGGHDVHNHHYHNPTFAATILFYMDEASEGHSGTTILKAKEGLDEAHTAAQTLDWRDLTEEAETVDYRACRLFAFHDCAIAYHSVKPSQPPARFGRRVYRLHVSAPDHHAKRIYGVSHEDYQAARVSPTEDEQVIGWMRRDIGEMRAVKRTLSDEAREQWRKSLLISVMQAQAKEPCKN